MRLNDLIQDLASLAAVALLILAVMNAAPILEWLMNHGVPT